MANAQDLAALIPASDLEHNLPPNLQLPFQQVRQAALALSRSVTSTENATRQRYVILFPNDEASLRLIMENNTCTAPLTPALYPTTPFAISDIHFRPERQAYIDWIEYVIMTMDVSLNMYLDDFNSKKQAFDTVARDNMLLYSVAGDVSAMLERFHAVAVQFQSSAKPPSYDLAMREIFDQIQKRARGAKGGLVGAKFRKKTFVESGCLEEWPGR